MEGIIGTPLDYGILITYFLGIMAFGTFFTRYITTTKDFFIGGQRFSWWLIAFSCVATSVGSYSFIKYSEIAYVYGVSCTQNYVNDWWMVPLFIFGWLPIIYFAKVLSVPEYLERRFDSKTRLMATVLILAYTVGYIGINLMTLGVAINVLTNGAISVMLGAILTAIIVMVYVTAGGQMAVIMTDCLQALILLGAGIGLFIGGIHFLHTQGAEFWSNLPVTHKFAFPHFNRPAEFNSVGIFWQDGASSAFFYFASQGLILRFLSCKSVRDGRKAILTVLAILTPIAALAVGNAGWLARAMENAGLIPPLTDTKAAFVAAARVICRPGLFGFIIAALTAALMSSVDTLVNATSALFVNDIWKRYVRPASSDRHYLRVARVVSLAGALIGILLVPIYMGFTTIYQAHAAFTATITPPLVITIFMAFLWKRYTPAAAFWTLLAGIAAIAVSMVYPKLILPFAHGVNLEGGAAYMRACYGIIICLGIGFMVSLFTKSKPKKEIVGLVWGTEKEAREKFKGGKINLKPGRKVLLEVKHQEMPGEVTIVRACPQAMAEMEAKTGDLLYVANRHWWYGGLRSAHVKAGEPISEDFDFGKIYLSWAIMREGRFKQGEKISVEKIM